ncbi:MAG: LamG domain-containing protein, partial [Myxococcota bacterium]|nr:LamG domain-containing protein [Myxococcota bacterium]
PDARVVQLPAPAILWRFDEGAGGRALDSSGSSALVHLRIEDPAAIEWLDDALALRAPTRLVSERAPIELVEAIRSSSAFTIEAWIVPAEEVVDQTRRIVSLSASVSSRDFTLAQGALSTEPASDAYVLRVRAGGSTNGLPMLSTGPGHARAQLTQVVAVHAPGGLETIYVDGAPVVSGAREGDLGSWADDHLFAIGDEHGTGTDVRRAWLGELHLVAIYPHALDARDVEALRAAGPTAR